MKVFSYAVLFMAVATASFIHGQERSAGDEAIEAYLAAEADMLSQNELAGAETREQWEAQREQLKREYFDMLGLWPLPERTDLRTRVTGTLERDHFVVEKLHFQSLPGLYVTGNLYLPNPLPKESEKLPAVLYVCGHSGRGRDGNKTAFQHHGMWFATHGYVCLIVDTLQLGEIAGIHHGTYNRERWWWHSAGYTSAGVECWNGIRAIDYLTQRPEVDPTRIAVTGISGGGAATFWIAAADDRVKVCVPVSGMSDLQTYVGEKVINGHCDCMFLYNTYRWEWTTIAALVAPRPMLFENSGHDPIFPMPANERIRTRLERIYNWYQPNPGELFDIGITPGGHKDNVELRLMAYRWINRHLKNDNNEVSEPTLPAFDGVDLRVFPTDADLPTDSLNAKIDESFVQLAEPNPPKSKSEFADWSKKLRSDLTERVFHDWPDEVSAAEVVEKRPNNQFVLSTEPGILALATRYGEKEVADDAKGSSRPSPPNATDRPRIVLVVLNPEDPVGQLPAWAKEIAGSTPKVVLSPRGCGEPLAWTRKNPPNYVERAHALLGRTVDAGRVWDVQAAARWLHEEEGGGDRAIIVAGSGPAGIIGAYAAHFEPSIESVIAVKPTTTHRDGPHFLSVLRVLDVPDLLGLLAPRNVTLITDQPQAFERTKSIFTAAGYSERLVIEE